MLCCYRGQTQCVTSNRLLGRMTGVKSAIGNCYSHRSVKTIWFNKMSVFMDKDSSTSATFLRSVHTNWYCKSSFECFSFWMCSKNKVHNIKCVWARAICFLDRLFIAWWCQQWCSSQRTYWENIFSHSLTNHRVTLWLHVSTSRDVNNAKNHRLNEGEASGVK